MDPSMNSSNSMNPTSMSNSTSMGGSSGSMPMGMMPWLHFGNADHVLFKAWQPSSPGAVAGACIGLVLFCILERCLAAFRRTRELRWRAKLVPTSSSEQCITGKGVLLASEYVPLSAHRQLVLSFNPSHDIPRGLIQAIQSTFSYALMLVVMTYNGAYIISIILGLGIGEVLFGRIARAQHDA